MSFLSFSSRPKRSALRKEELVLEAMMVVNGGFVVRRLMPEGRKMVRDGL